MKKYIAEGVGTMLLVLIGCGAAMFAGADVLAIATAFGLTVTALAYTIGNISGCHVNPAVTLACALDKRMSWNEAKNYIIAQFIGGIVGALILLVLVLAMDDSNKALVACSNHALGDRAEGIVGAFLVEIVFTCIFVFVVLAATDEKYGAGNKAGVVIGGALLLVHIVCIQLTGTSVNPARSFGPALFAGLDALKWVWIFLIAPCLGGAAAVYVWRFVKDGVGQK